MIPFADNGLKADMTREDSLKLDRGEMAEYCYRVARTKAELIAIVKDCLTMGGRVISADCTKDFQFAFGLPADGKGAVAFSSDEFLDDDETVGNPHYRRMAFDSAEEAVEGFEVDGIGVWPWAQGRRIAVSDVPMPV